MQLTAGAGITVGTDQGVRIVFSGTPGEFARASTILPMDYVSGTDVTFKFFMQVDTTQSIAYNYYLASARNGSTSGQWNVANNQTLASSSHTQNQVIEKSITMAAANFQAGDQVSVAIKPNGALTGNAYLNLAFIEYTADS